MTRKRPFTYLLVRWPLLAATILLTATMGCSDDDDDNNNNNQTPGTGGEASAPDQWGRIRLEQLPNLPIDTCTTSSQFSLNQDLSWTFTRCEDQRSGAFTQDEANVITSLVDVVNNADLSNRQCINQIAALREQLNIVFNNGNDVTIIDRSPTEYCYAGDQASDESLLNYIRDLESKYIQATPTPTPSPSPSPTPKTTPTPRTSPTPTPTPRQSPTPTASPTPTPTPTATPGASPTPSPTAA